MMMDEATATEKALADAYVLTQGMMPTVIIVTPTNI